MFETLAQLSILEWLGYIASVIIALSMTLTSIVKFRIVNLIGAAMFSAYGFVIGAYPVGILNLFIVSVDVYYLFNLFGRKDIFELLEIRPDNRYLARYLSFHQREIETFFPGFTHQSDRVSLSFFVLRNTSVAGIFLGKKNEDNTMSVLLDYVAPNFRDYKNGRFVYSYLSESLIQQGITTLIADDSSSKHASYLLANGFKKTKQGHFEKRLIPNP